MQIGRKIYYELATGNVVTDTGERSGEVVETTIAEDFSTYTALAGRIPESVGVLQLEYGQYADDFAQCNGYRIDMETLEVLFSYSDPQNPEAPPVYQQPLTEQVAGLKVELTAANEANLTTMSALADVFEQVLLLQEQLTQIQGTGS